MAKGIALRPRNGLQGPSLLAFLLIFPATVLSAPAEVYVGLQSRFSDNITKASQREIDDTEHQVSLRAIVQTDPGRCVASANGDVAYSIYEEETYDPETQINAGFFGTCDLARGLSWAVDNQLREITRSSRLNDTPDNRTRKNVFQTGPSYIWRMSSRNSIQLSARYENTDFQESEDPDSEGVTGSISWNHLFNATLSAGLSSSARFVELETGAEIQTRTVSAIFNKQWATTSVSGSLGVSEIETEIGSIRRETYGVVGDITINRALDASADVYFVASHELTDQTSDFGSRFDEFRLGLANSNTVEVTSIEAGLNKSFSYGDTLSVAAYANRSDYLDTDEREDQVGVRTSYSRQLSSVLFGVGNARYEFLSYESDQTEDQILGVDIGLVLQASPRLELAATAGRTQRISDIRAQEFDENWVLLSVEYKLR